MPTYDDLIKQLESEIDSAVESNQLIDALEKSLELSNTYFDLGMDFMGTMNYGEAVSAFNSAGEEAFMFKNYQKKITGDVDFKNDPETAQKIDAIINENDDNLLLIKAWSNFCSGQLNNTNRNPGIAATFYEEASKNFDNVFNATGNICWQIFSKYNFALKLFAEALEDLYRTSFRNSKIKSQRAIVVLQKLIDEDLESIKDKEEYKAFYDEGINKFKSDLQTTRSYYYISDARDQFNTRNFKNASRQFANVVKEFDISIKNYNQSLNETLRTLALGEYHNYLGWQLLSEAELYREQEKWDLAFNNYEAARQEWEKASSFYLESNMQSSQALQETVLNSALLIDVYQAQCEKEKDLNETITTLRNDIQSLRDKINDAIKPMGITVNNTQDVVTTVEQNAQFIQHIENKARENIQELLDALKQTQMDSNEKNKIEKNGKELLDSNEKGHKFFDKVKSFTKDVAEIVKNVGEIAAPLMPAFKALLALI